MTVRRVDPENMMPQRCPPGFEPWTREEDARLRAQLAAGYFPSEILALFPGRTLNAIQYRARALGVQTDRVARRTLRPQQPTPEPPAVPAVEVPIAPPPPPPDPIEEEQKRQHRVAALKAERELLKEVAGERSLRAHLEALAHAVAKEMAPPPSIVPRIPVGADASEETLVLMFSDWHAYEVVDPERVRGFNAYDATIMGQRVQRIVDSALSIKARMERGGGWRFPRLVVGCNGDIVSGTIHEVERHSDAPSIVHAVYGAGLVLAQAIRDLSAHFGQVEVFCTPGNHGRLPDARRMQQKDPWRSWDTLIALFAKEHLRAIPHVQFFIPNSYSVGFEVEGWKFLQTHGHDVKSWNSIPWYGLNRLVSNINALEAGRGEIVHHYLFGHFHTTTSLPHAAGESFINGSLIGGNEFSVNALGRADRPAQWLLGVHQEHGVTHRWPLRADGREISAPRYQIDPWRIAG